jgi:hypothetical protein
MVGTNSGWHCPYNPKVTGSKPVPAIPAGHHLCHEAPIRHRQASPIDLINEQSEVDRLPRQIHKISLIEDSLSARKGAKYRATPGHYSSCRPRGDGSAPRARSCLY